MFSYNVVIGNHDCLVCPFEFDFLEDCLDSACAEMRINKGRYFPLNVVGFIYHDYKLVKRINYINGDVYSLEDCN